MLFCFGFGMAVLLFIPETIFTFLFVIGCLVLGYNLFCCWWSGSKRKSDKVYRAIRQYLVAAGWLFDARDRGHGGLSCFIDRIWFMDGFLDKKKALPKLLSFTMPSDVPRILFH